MPGLIPISQASPLYTMGLKSRFDEMQDIKVNNFWRSFFTEVESKERYPVIDVRRGSEKVAIDVPRGHQGTRTQISRYTQKAFDPFYYKLYYDATELECYFRVFGSNAFTMNDMTDMVNAVALQNKSNQDMIERAVELHCATIMENGTVTSFRTGDVMDYKRKAASMVDLGAGFYWTTAGTDPFADMKNGGDFQRQVGKSQGFVINTVFGSQAWSAFRNNSVVMERLKQFNNRRDMITPAQLQSTGAIYQGDIDCDSYIIRAWTYNEFYEDPSNPTPTLIPYMNPKKVYMIAENPGFDLIYAATPQVVRPGTNTSSLVVGKYILKDFVNEEENYHRFYIESAPIPVPKAIDRIYTMQVVG